jgi:hypothetical protein
MWTNDSGQNLRSSLKELTLYNRLVLPFARRVRRRILYTRDQLYVARLRHSSISKKQFIDDIKDSIINNTGYATGKIGLSPKYWMYYEIFLSKETDAETTRQFEETLNFHGLKQSGVFPADPRFYLDFNKFYMQHIRNLDCLGLFYEPPLMELELIKHYQLKNKFIYYVDQEPDRSVIDNPENCYLQYFKGKKLLVICPFAEFLKERATKEVFEAVWSKTGKKWFYPRSVDALELPYGFSAETHKTYSTAIDLFHDIAREIDKRDFDVALIGAAGLAIPIASYIKNMGKIGIDLGGHLQICFGVLGNRWRRRKDFERDYFNDSWIYLPAQYRPDPLEVGDYDYW